LEKSAGLSRRLRWVPQEDNYSESEITAGIAATDLLAEPSTWINRRVETIELLSHEETRRRVSIDFTLPEKKKTELDTEHGVVVPISVLTKEARKNFDLRDENGGAVPVLGKKSNAALSHIAVMNAALDALPEDPAPEAFDLLWSDLRQVVAATPEQADEALSVFVWNAEAGDSLRSTIWQDDTCRSLLRLLQDNYVLFAVLDTGGPKRRILKYSYSEDFETTVEGSLSERLAPNVLWERASRPDRIHFLVECPAAWRAASFHVEVAIPEELRVEAAVLADEEGEPVSDPTFNRNRASLYASEPLSEESVSDVFITVAPEKRGRTMQAAATAVVVTSLLWLGVHSGLDAKEADAAVSLLLAGAALYSGITAVRGEHALVTKLFSASRRWLGVVGLAALVASASLAMQVPDPHPVGTWKIAAIAGAIASIRLVWSAIRAPGYTGIGKPDGDGGSSG
jgi:hypothetical protein